MTQGDNTPRTFSDAYIDQCFTVWYSLGQPKNLNILQEQIPNNPEGRKPGVAHLRQIVNDYSWIERADALNAKAIEKVEHQLIDMKSDMLKRQAKTAFDIAKKAEDYLLENGFDTAASAVNAIKWAQEEERTVRGVSEMMIKISKMTPDELMAEAAKLLKRNSEVIDIVPEEMDVTDNDSDST